MGEKYERELEDESRIMENSRRGYWANKAEFILACLGNAWGATTWVRFPFSCYRHGGFPVFFIAYIIMLFHIGFPMMLLEMTLGQYSSQGVLNVWRLCPLFRGVGVSILLYGCISLTHHIYYLSWPIYYMYVSFTSAWLECGNSWNTHGCVSLNTNPIPELPFLNSTTCEQKSYTVEYDGYCYEFGKRVAVHDDYISNTQALQFSSPTEEFFELAFLQSSSVLRFQTIPPQILALAVWWIVVALCLCLGVRSLGKVVYFTSTVPLVLLIVLLGRALTLPGAAEGMKFLFYPDFTRLLSLHLWIDAATEALFGLGLGYGGYLTLASYNRFKNFYVLDATIVVLVHIVVRVLAAVIVMGFAGFLAYQMGRSLNDVMTSGPKAIFVVIPDALSRLPASSVWCFLLFFLVFLMNLGSSLPVTEVILTTLCDLWRPLQRFRFVVVGIFSGFFFLVGIFFCTNIGYDVFMALDWHIYFFYFISICAMSVCVAVFYGICRIRHDIGLMLGDCHLGWWITAGLALIPAAFHWFLIPLTSLFLLIASALEYRPGSLPLWAPVLGFITLAIILLPMLLCPIIMFIIACCRGCRCWPVIRPESKWGPHLSRFRIKATHLPHINVSPTEGVGLHNMAPGNRYNF